MAVARMPGAACVVRHAGESAAIREEDMAVSRARRRARGGPGLCQIGL